MDVHSPEQRHFNMSRIRGKDTKPEMVIRRGLWADGYRYRLQCRDLPGKPDIVLPKYHASIFVHGCFWHRHNCSAATEPKTNNAFWYKKLEANRIRDEKVVEELIDIGWRVGIVWECALKTSRKSNQAIAQIEKWLHSRRKKVEIPPKKSCKTAPI